jgi:predicted RNase H-like HicB family nuclease
MIYNVILSKQDNQYLARAKEWPEVWVTGVTRDQAISRVQTQLSEYLTQDMEVIPIEVPIPTHTANPWLEKFGWFKDDPTFADLQTEIEAYRRTLEQANSSEVDP